MDNGAKQALIIAMIYGILSAVWVLVANLVLAVIGLMAGAAWWAFTGTVDSEAIAEGLTIPLVVLSSVVVTGGVVIIGILLGKRVASPTKDLLGWHPVSPIVWVGALGATTVGWFPGWLASQLMEWVPWMNLGNLEMVNELVAQANVIEIAALGFMICIAAPILEELVFRGILWEFLARALPPWGVWILTSIAFALFHLDPIHIISVFGIGAFLGLLRWMGGGIGPCILAHFVNNAMGMAVMTIQWQPQLAGWQLALSVGVTFVFAGVAVIGRSKHVKRHPPRDSTP